MTEPLLNIHHKYTEFDQSWTYRYSRGWNGAHHFFEQESDRGLLKVTIFDPLDHDERDEVHEDIWRIFNESGRALYEHWSVDIGIDTGYTMSYFDIDDLQGMIDVLKPWQLICDSHNGVNKQFAQIDDFALTLAQEGYVIHKCLSEFKGKELDATTMDWSG